LTTAVLSPDGAHWILNGQKMWITNGGFADVFIVFAKVEGEKLSCFIVEKSYPGFKVGGEEKKMGIKGSSTVPIFFDNCKVPKENLLFEIGGGFKVAVNTLNVGRFNLGAYCLGGAKNVLAVTAKYAKERKAFGKSLADFGMIREKLAEMALRIFAVESMIYRSAGMIEAAMDAAHGAEDKTKELMRVLEEYAIESSISKVYGSEALDYVVDEAVQIYGGYGFHEEYPVARAYRDSRINRIFEGTNEINRMLMIDMLLRRAVKGTLPVFAAATKLAAEVLAGPLLGGGSEPKGLLGAEEQVVASAKKTFLLAGGQAAQKYREGLKDQQEILRAMANMLMETYAMESCLLRTQKAAAARGQAAAQVMVDATRAFVYDAADRVEKEARTVLAATFEGDTLRTQLAVLKRFHKREGVGGVALRRNVAAAVLAGDRYPFEGR
ncbi:MAG: acyl-CoA dehydrogenase family protein, partial [Candidatus Acidiferrales bacterium]